MNHRIGFNKLSRKDSHRKAMTRNMVTSIFRYERIKTTKAKALEIRRKAEKMITRAKIDSVHNRRIVAKDITDKAVLAKLFTDIAPRFVERNGGYTRILKLGRRVGDAAEIVFLELVERKEKEVKPVKKDKTVKAEAVKETVKEKAKDTVKETGKEKTKNTVKKTVKEKTKDTVKETVKEKAEDTVKETGKES